MKTVSQVRHICDPFDPALTDCVMQSHILYYALTKAKVRPALFMGCDRNNPAVYNRVTGTSFGHHMWLVLDTREGSAIVDYRAREWVGSRGDTPHGVFLKRKYPHMVYAGHKLGPSLS